MAKVNTVLGPMDTADMGVTLMHEHVLGSSIAIPQLIDLGYKDRLCVSHDWARARHVASDSPIGSPAKRKKLNPHNYLYIMNVVFPQLREMGVSKNVINTILVDAPRKFFEER